LHNLRSNFYKFFDLTKSVFKDRINSSDNLKYYSYKPKITDCEIIASSLTSESLGIDSENYLWVKLKCDHSSVFPNLIDRCNLNRMCKKLYPRIELLNQTVAAKQQTFEPSGVRFSIMNLTAQHVTYIYDVYDIFVI